MISATEKDRIRSVAAELHAAAKPIRVLGSLAWPANVREDFLASGGDHLPEVEYEPYDPTDTLAAVATARRSIFPGEPIDTWLEGTADSIETTARMMATRGTEAFRAHGRRLYGGPDEPLRYDPATPTDLADQVLAIIDQVGHAGLRFPEPEGDDAEEVAVVIESAVQRHFGESAPRVELVDELSANALATASRIRIRRGAKFTDRDARQLLQHEAYIHVGTSLNGRHQPDLPILAVGHPGTTRTQEGLAVYAELMSGTLDLDRFRRLAWRVQAIAMALAGADFIEVYRWFGERIDDPVQAFESTRRVFRGGVLTGGAPFLKDVVYLGGLLEVATYVRAALSAGRIDCLALLFVGKLDIRAIPALGILANAGLCRRAKFVPPWVSDPRSVLASLTWSVFAGRIDLPQVAMAVERILSRTETVTFVEPRDEAPDTAAVEPAAAE
jgi:uncharacterized protein (TIGR02421 family)